MVNERKTENIVRKYLEKNGYYSNPDIVVEEKKSDNPKIDKLLKNASKKGNKQGYPEFIITSTKYSESLIVIECKADILKHVSKTMDCYPDYAVDGALLYASFLAKEYDVIAIGVSGMTANKLSISHYLYLKGENKPHSIFSNKILSFEEYYDGYIKSDYKQNQDFNKLVIYTKDLNELLQEKKIQQPERALLISGILISLRNDAFKTGYTKHRSAKSLIDNLYSTICTELAQSDITQENVEKLKVVFGFIKVDQSLTDEGEGKQLTERLISDIDKEINSFIKTHMFFDVISKFYVEFLRYSNSDRGLGIVLTPPHITDLFTELADINKDSVVFDNCCGTGGFLVSSMKKMIFEAKGDKQKEIEIKEKQIVGIEYQTNIYALLISNMIIHQDGKISAILGDCFKENEKIKQKYEPTVGLLNPPYKTKKAFREELEFVLNNLDSLKEGGRCIALMPISCATKTSGTIKELKKQILKHHTLEAVMSMPEELFYGQTNSVSCAMVITAHKPHPAGKKTWFGYWRDDGFIKVKEMGRIDKNNTWERTKLQWLNAYRNREIIDKFSLTKEVTEDDEWCAEAYMETDYSQLSEKDFIKVVKNYVAYELFKKNED